jgi:DnaK suppressor protein
VFIKQFFYGVIYTVKDYQAIQEQLEQRFAMLQTRLQKITSDVQHQTEPLSPDFAEQAVQRENDEVLTALDDSIRAEMQQIQESFVHLKNGDYGVCAICQKKIPLKRLAALPHSIHCVSCAEHAGY